MGEASHPSRDVRKSGDDGNNKVWAIRKKVGLMLIIRYGQYIFDGCKKLRGKVKVMCVK